MKKMALILLLIILPACSLGVDDSRDIAFVTSGLKVLDLHGVNIRVIQYPKVPGDFLTGYMFGKTEKDGDSTYTISIYGRWIGRAHFWEILSHELIHVKQLYTNELDYSIKLGEAYWKGDTVKFKDINYKDRPWEIEAFAKADSVSNLIRDELRRKKIKASKARLKRFQRDVTKAIGLD
jgi:hypothetical protein